MSKRNFRRFKKTSINKQFKQQEQEGRQEGRKEEEGGMGIKKCLKFCKNTGGNEEMKKRRNKEMKKARNEETRKPRKKKQRREEMKKQRKEDRRPRRNEETRKRKLETQKKKRQHIPTCATVLSSSSIVCYEHSPPDALLVSKRHYL